MNPQELIEEIYRTRFVTDPSGQKYPLNGSEISPEEGSFVTRLIQERPNVKETLEVGCAYGLSSLHICGATEHRHGKHTILDPFQERDWHGIGLSNLRLAGLNHWDFFDSGSEIALPKILDRVSNSKFDFFFIDGWHTLDHTLLDCFYATRLLKIGGVLVVDDTDHAAVAKTMRYLSQYPCYKIIGQVGGAPTPRGMKLFEKFFSHRVCRRIFRPVSPSMMALEKISEDTRLWDWFTDF